MTPTPEEAVDRISARFGPQDGHRALHAKGTFLTGTFTATAAATARCRAAHLQGGEVPVRARLSNGGGDPSVPDNQPDVRGLAVKFDLPDGSATDLSSQSVPRFALATVEKFLQLVAVGDQPLRVLGLAARNPAFARSLPTNAPALRPPPSFANVHFYAIHAFKWIAADGAESWVRYEWVPEAGSERLGAREAKGRGRDYLFDELAARLRTGPLRWTLSVQIAAPGDDPDDPTTHWPPERERIDAGTLSLTALADFDEPVVFDPSRLTDGLGLSDDPILRFRPDAYSVSVGRRTG